MFRLEFFSVEICFYVNGGWINTNGVLFIFISQFYKVIHSYFDLQKILCERRDEFGPQQIMFGHKYIKSPKFDINCNVYDIIFENMDNVHNAYIST